LHWLTPVQEIIHCGPLDEQCSSIAMHDHPDASSRHQYVAYRSGCGDSCGRGGCGVARGRCSMMGTSHTYCAIACDFIVNCRDSNSSTSFVHGPYWLLLWMQQQRRRCWRPPPPPWLPQRQLMMRQLRWCWRQRRQSLQLPAELRACHTQQHLYRWLEGMRSWGAVSRHDMCPKCRKVVSCTRQTSSDQD
jgi:hypothetical protein